MPISLPQVSLPTWSQTKTTSKQGFDKVYNLVDKLGAPINKLTNKIGSEAFWPTTLDKESDKAARILRSFCKDGFYVEQEQPSAEGPKAKQKVVQKIPSQVIKKAKGLAIFTTMRTGLWVSGAGGSGILVARKEDGEWSPPSGILLHTAGLGFLVGVDIYDCVVVINTDKALEAFTKIRCTLGGEVSAVAGPVGVGGVLETEIHKRQAPVWNYLKSRGFYAGVQIDGTVIIERGDENERFYGERLAVKDILAGKVRHPPYEIRTLMATIKAAQGDTVDESILPPSEPTPGDMELEKPETPAGFGLPPPEDDDDPYGVKALEKEGMEVKEAGTHTRPSMEAFEYKPSASSPIYTSFRRQSADSMGMKNSKRSSIRSVASTDRGTQTNDLDLSPTKQVNGDSRESSPTQSIPEHVKERGTEDTNDQAGKGDLRAVEDDPDQPAPIVTKARLVSIPKRTPPTLPPRNPNRQSPTYVNPETLAGPASADQGTNAHTPSPSKDDGMNFQEVDINYETPTSRKQDLVEGLKNIGLSQSSQRNPRQANVDTPSSLNKDRFDAGSVSGSEYSKETQVQPQQQPITMQDKEADDTPTKMRDDKATEASEEFHSMPSTPVEAITPGFNGKIGARDNYSQ